MKNVILVDYDTPENWEFQEALEKATNKKWKVIKSISNLNHGKKYQELIRYFKYFSLPLKIFMKRNRYASVFAWQQFYGLILGFYFKLFHVKKAPEITVMTFIYKPKNSILGKIYERFMRCIVKSGYIKRFIVFSKSERDYYSSLFEVPKEWFQVERLGIEDEYKKYGCRITREQFYLAAGRSNRDYTFLVGAWRNEDRLKIVCDSFDGIDSRSVQYLKDCHNEQYMKELSACYAVIIPLQNEKISSGQLVILQAMMLGKPVIITKNDTVSDYVENGVDGIIIDKDVTSLKWAIEQLKDQKVYNTISENARESFETKFSLYAMGLRIGNKL